MVLRIKFPFPLFSWSIASILLIHWFIISTTWTWTGVGTPFAGAQTSSAEREPLDTFSEGSLLFASKLYDALKDIQGDNLIFAPSIIQTNIATIIPATNGSTTQSLIANLHVNTSILRESQYIQSLPTDLDEIRFESTQMLYIPANYELDDNFEELINEEFTELETPFTVINFARSVTAAKKINNFIRRSTKGKINNIVVPEYFSGATKLVCVSGVYFDARWAKTFPKSSLENFYSNGGEVKEVEMMNMLTKLPYQDLAGLNGSAVKLDFAGRRLSLLVLVPYTLDGLRHMEKNLRRYSLKSIVDGMHKRNVDLYMPKFKIESSIVMNTHRAYFRKLGLDTISSPRETPDFSRLSAKKGMHLDQVIQKTIFEVDEEGVGNPPKLKKLKNQNEPVVFRADHPFIMFVYDQETKTVLFLGKKVS